MDLKNKKVKDKLNNAIKEHMEKLNTLLENKNELQYKYDSLVKKESNVTEKLSFSKDKQIDKEKEIEEINKLKQELSKTTNIYSEKMDEVNLQLEELINESKELKEKIIKLENEKQSIQKELNISKQRIIELEEENSGYLKKIKEQKEEIENKLNEIEILNNRTEILKNETNNDTKIQDLTSNNNLLLASKEEELNSISLKLKEKEKELLEQLQLVKAMEEQVKEYTRENNEINEIINKFESESDALFSKAGLNSTSKVLKISNRPNRIRFNTSNSYQSDALLNKASQYSNDQVSINRRSDTTIYRQIEQERLKKIDLIKQLIILIEIRTKQLVADGDKTSFDQNIRYVNDTIDIINRRLESDEINLESLSENINNILNVCDRAKETNDQNYKKQFCTIYELFLDIYKIIEPSNKLFNQMNTRKIENNPRFEEFDALSDTSSVAAEDKDKKK